VFVLLISGQNLCLWTHHPEDSEKRTLSKLTREDELDRTP